MVTRRRLEGKQKSREHRLGTTTHVKAVFKFGGVFAQMYGGDVNVSALDAVLEAGTPAMVNAWRLYLTWLHSLIGGVLQGRPRPHEVLRRVLMFRLKALALEDYREPKHVPVVTAGGVKVMIPDNGRDS